MAGVMQQLRESLVAALLPRLEKELGREALLRLLWPQVVGSQVASHTTLKGIRGTTLVIGVRDRSWIKTLGSLQSTMLDAINRWAGGQYKSIELVEQPGMPALSQAAPVSAAKRNVQAGADTPALAAVITDASLRAMFRESAAKYFAARSAPKAASKSRDQDVERNQR